MINIIDTTQKYHKLNDYQLMPENAKDGYIHSSLHAGYVHFHRGYLILGLPVLVFGVWINF